MKIFGITIETKKELRAKNDELTKKNSELIGRMTCLADDLDLANDELHYMQLMFPLELDQVVFDIALKNAQGKYTKKNPSFEHSTITEVTVNEKNYFSLVKRLRNNDVFYTKKDAEEYLKSVCK